MEIKRIVHATSVHQSLDNRILFKECSSLASAGFEVHLVAQSIRDEVINGVQIHAIPSPGSRFSRFFLTVVTILRICRRLDADLYHLHDAELIPMGLILRIFLGKRVIFDMHENLPKAILSKPWIPKPLRPFIGGIIWCFERVVLNAFSVVFAEDSYRREYGFVTSGCVVRNFPRVRTLLDINENKNDRFSIIYLGSISEQRGFSQMLRLMEALDKQDLSVELHIVGKTDKAIEDQVRRMADFLRYSSVFLHGFLRADDAYKIASRCHVGLAVLKRIPNYVESYPTKIFEYMALGIKVITSDFPLYKSVVSCDEIGYLVEPDNDEALIQSVLRLHRDEFSHLQNPIELSRVRAAAFYSWEGEFEKLLNFVRSQIEK